jgi:Tfp pilus assembly protein PilF
LRLLITILFFTFSQLGFSQDLVTLANGMLNDKNYIQAKTTIEEAFKSGEMESNARGWYTQGRIYHEILKSDDPKVKSLKSNPKDFASEIVLCYNKTKILTEPGDNLYILASNQIEILWADGINKGYKDYQSQKFKSAAKSFEIAQVAKPRDTTAYIYAGYSAQNAQEYEKAIKYYTAIKSFARLSKTVYNRMFLCKQAMNAPLEEILDLIEEAIFEYPDHLPYIAEEVRALIKLNKLEEAESRLNTVLQRYPNNYELRLRRADLFDRIFKEAYTNGLPERSERYFDLASEDYEIYLNKFPKDFTANYNYAVMLNEQANRIYVRVNLMNKEEYMVSGKDVEEMGHNWTRKALPYMENAESIIPGDKNVNIALKFFYERLKMDDKLNKLKEKGGQ